MRNHEYLVACVVRILERGYRFQYQILHLAMQLTSAASILDKQPLHEVPKVSLPPPGKDLPDKVIKLSALLSQQIITIFVTSRVLRKIIKIFFVNGILQ